MFGDSERGSNDAGYVYTTIFAVGCGAILLCNRSFREAPWLTVGGALTTIAVALLTVVSVLITPAPPGADTSTVVASSSFLDAAGGIADMSTAFACA